MNTSNATVSTFNGSIPTNWTIDDLLERLGQDERCIDALDPESLRRIEASVTPAAATPGRTADPGTIALVRSIAAQRLQDPALGARRISELLAGQGREDHAARVPPRRSTRYSAGIPGPIRTDTSVAGTTPQLAQSATA